MLEQNRMQREAERRLHGAFGTLINSDNTRISRLATSLHERLGGRDSMGITLHPSDDFIDIPVVDFQLVEFELPSGSVAYPPCLVFNPERVLVASQSRLASDLVYSAALASRFPENGYEGRLHRVYAGALGVQEMWNSLNDQPTVLAEHTLDGQILARMKDVAFYLDVGVADWQKALTIHEYILGDQFEEVNSDLAIFFSLRRFYLPALYTSNMEEPGGRERLLSYSRDRRARYAAAFLAEIAVERAMKASSED